MFCGLNSDDTTNQEQTKKIQNYIYNPNQPIGRGNFSQVFRGINENNGKSVAIKVIKYSSLSSRVAEQLLKNQIQILKEMNHENVLKCHQVLSSKNNCYIITDFYEGGDLEKVLHRQKRFMEKDISKIVFDVYQGLLYLNNLSIVHRDFKVANIFLTANGSCKIADFGFAIKATQPFKDIKIGSPIYMSPEGLLLNEYGPKTDVWSFGILVYELLHGDTPLAGSRTEGQLKQRVLLPPKINQGLSAQIKQFINLCLTVDPKHRLDIRKLRQTSYMKRVYMEVERPRVVKDMSSTMYTSSTNSNVLVPMIQNITTYAQGLAVLQYCRLIHKTCQANPSAILSQWLLNICEKLQRMHIEKQYQKNDKLLSTVRQYYIKYQRSHEDNKIQLYFDDIIRESKRLLHNSHSRSNKHLHLLIKETQMLQKYSNLNQLYHYVKHTEIEQFLQSKMNKTTFNFQK